MLLRPVLMPVLRNPLQGIADSVQDYLAELRGSSQFWADLTHTAIPIRSNGETATFTRATPKTVQNNDGYLVTLLAGELGFPGARRVRNLAVASEDFAGAAWTEVRSTLVANSTTAPNGTATATKITSNSALTTTHFLIDNNTLVPSNELRLYSIYVKPDTHNYVALNIQGGAGNYVTKVFDLTNGVVGETFVGGTSGTLTSSAITDEGDGWYRISILAKITSAGTRNFVVFFASAASGNTINTTGDISIAATTGTEAFYLWGAQIEDVTAQTTQTAGEYVSVGVESAPYYHGSMVDGVKCFSTDLSGNPLTTMERYKPEPADTNDYAYSEDLSVAPWTSVRCSSVANSGVSPTGSTTATICTAAAGAATSHFIYCATTSPSATLKVYDIYAKKGTHNFIALNLQPLMPSPNNYVTVVFDLNAGAIGEQLVGASSGTVTDKSIEALRDGWYRVSMTASITGTGMFVIFFANSATGNTISATGDISIASTDGTETVYLFGVERKGTKSSYIPTTTVAVARNADILTYTGGNCANFKTLHAGFSRETGVSTVGTVAALSDGTANEYSSISLQSATALRFDGVDGGASQWQTTASNAYTPGTETKAAYSAATNSILMDKDGTAQTADTTATLPTVTQLQVGHLNGANVANANIGPVAAWTRNLSQPNIAALDRAYS